MFLLSRRQAHAVLAGIAAAAAWAAAEELGSKRPVRVAGLVTLASLAMAGITTGALPRNSKIYATENRLNHFIGTGGSVGGQFTANGNITSTGALSAQSTTGNSTLGSIAGDKDNDSNCTQASGSVTVAEYNGCASRVDNLKAAHNSLVDDVQACISRVNNLTTALG
jgi:hypothetical protein